MIFPFNLQTTLIASGVALVVGLYGGYKLTSNHYEAKQSKVDQAVIEQLVSQASIDRKVIENYQTNEHTLQRAYIELGRKSREVKITTNKCELTESGRVLWNESLSGEASVSETPSGATGTGTTDFARAFENKLLNDEICARNREKLEALKKWDKETYDD
jgi:uncharacterized protein YneF (UPF0154 family)